MSKKHYAAGPDRNGDIHTRSSISTGKTFTHCVVVHWSYGKSAANWSSRLDLAQAQHALNLRNGGESEILEARVLDKPLPSKGSKAVRP